MRNTPKHPDSNRTRLDLTLTCQVLADGLSIHSLTRKTSYCQGTKRYKGARERERKKMEVKVNQISSFQLTKLKNWKLLTRDCFEATDYFYWVKPAIQIFQSHTVYIKKSIVYILPWICGPWF